MSIHKSFKSNDKGKKRTVHKRWERIRSLMLQKKFEEGQSVYGLPKQKIVKLKIRKEKKEKVEGLTPVAELAKDNNKKKKKSNDVGKIK